MRLKCLLVRSFLKSCKSSTSQKISSRLLQPQADGFGLNPIHSCSSYTAREETPFESSADAHAQGFVDGTMHKMGIPCIQMYIQILCVTKASEDVVDLFLPSPLSFA